MRQRDWPVPEKKKGEVLEPTSFKFSLPFLFALREFSEMETARLSRKIGRENILQTLALERCAQLRRLMKKHEDVLNRWKEDAPPTVPS